MPNVIHKQIIDLTEAEGGPHGESIVTLKLPKRSEILSLQNKPIGDATGLDLGSQISLWYSFPVGTEEMVEVKVYAIMTGQEYAGPPFKDLAREYDEGHLSYLATTQHAHGTYIIHWFFLPHPYVMKAT